MLEALGQSTNESMVRIDRRRTSGNTPGIRLRNRPQNLVGNLAKDLTPEEVQRLLQTFMELNFRFPSKQGAGLGDVGTTARWVVLRQGLEGEFAP